MRKFVSRHGRFVFAGCATFVLLAAALGVTLQANVRAERARIQAEARFQQTRAIANSLLFEVFDEVSATAGSTRAREMLARTGLSYLEALAADETKNGGAPAGLRVTSRFPCGVTVLIPTLPTKLDIPLPVEVSTLK